MSTPSSKNKPQISIIVLNWNGKKWLGACFQSISKQTFTDFETILIDNNSDDGSVEYTRKNWPQIQVVGNKKNLGYALANNIGAKKARGKYLFFLNNDTKLEHQTLEQLFTAAQTHPEKGIFFPKIKGYEGQELFPRSLPYLGIDHFSYPGPSRIPFYADGAALFIPKKIFEEVGEFDEKYFIFQEDIDLSWRTQILGYEIIPVHQAIVYHQSGGNIQGGAIKQKGKHQSSIFRRFHTEKNSLRNIIKNYQTINCLKIVPIHIILALGESLVYLLSGRFKASLAILKAIYWNINNFKDTLKKRRVIQRQRIIKDRAIIPRMLKGSMKWQAYKNIGGVPYFK